MHANARPDQRKPGQALLELALILPVTLLLGLAAVDFGRAYWSGVAFAHGARDGARYVAGSTGTDAPSETEAKQRVLDAIGTQSFAESSASNAALATSDVTITISDESGSNVTYSSRASGNMVKVEVTGFVEFYTAFLAEGVDFFAPGLGLCKGTGAAKRCGIEVQGLAYMAVL